MDVGAYEMLVQSSHETAWLRSSVGLAVNTLTSFAQLDLVVEHDNLICFPTNSH